MNNYILNLGVQAKKASAELSKLNEETKNRILNEVAKSLIENKDKIKEENEKDIISGQENGLTSAFLDRLKLTDARIESMSDGLKEIAKFKDPIGQIIENWELDNGLKIKKVVVPIGTIGMIFESRPNVTIDASGLAIKSGNSIILRGGSSAINSNKILKDIFVETGIKYGMPEYAVQLVEDTSRDLVLDLVKMSDYLDIIIPRGGKGLKNFILENATVPMIETGAGLCHIFIDETADMKEALPIIINAKIQRPSTCNSVETILLHENIANKIYPDLIKELLDNKVEVRVEKEYLNISDNLVEATEEDWKTEYGDMIISIKVVKNTEEAINHINKYGTKHSESILSKDINSIEKFLNEVDAAVVYTNASTRFTDGQQFGFGGEIGISTQKLHARGPMGVKALTSTKYIVEGNGQIRK